MITKYYPHEKQSRIIVFYRFLNNHNIIFHNIFLIIFN
jgi:hypothetical protein